MYRNGRKLSENNFNQDLHNQLSSEQPKDYSSLEKLFLSILEEHAPVKEQLVRSNHELYVAEALRESSYIIVF